jgi:hypothetical protein
MNSSAKNPDLDAAKRKLHELNAKVLSDPCNKLLCIKEFYAEQTPDDTNVADIALIIYSIASAGDQLMSSNQTTHLKVAAPILFFAIAVAGILCLAAIIVGGYAVFKNQASGITEIHVFETSVSTTNVGIGLIFIGVTGMFVTLRSAFANFSYKHLPEKTATVDLTAKSDE